MSIVSSVFTVRSSSWGPLHARAASLMDSIFAIAAGLGLRLVVGAVSHHDFRLTGTLVGLWEGVVMLHFVKKLPNSYDPYIAFAVRLFVDFLVTESVARLVLVLVWTGLGMVFADIAPALWVDVGLHRIWRRFRRDMYTISSKIPRVALFPTRARTVRFSPSRTPTVLTTVSSSSPSTANPTTRVIPPTPSPARAVRRPVPGSYPGAFSETETDIGSILGLRPLPPFSDASTSALGTAHHRYSSTRHRKYSDTPTELSNDLDDGNLSDSVSSSSTSTLDPSAFNPSEIPDVEEELQPVKTPAPVLDKGKQPMRGVDDETPRPNPIKLPPTPSDSARAFDFPLDVDAEEPPPTSKMPHIPDDSFEFSEWETVNKEDAADVPPALPPKDVMYTHFPRTPSPTPQLVPPPVEPVPPPVEPLPVPSPEESSAQVPPTQAPPAQATTGFDGMDDFEMNFGDAPGFPVPQHLQQQQQTSDSAGPGINDLMGMGTDRPPSYAEPYGGAFGESTTPPEKPAEGLVGDVIPEETESALVSPVNQEEAAGDGAPTATDAAAAAITASAAAVTASAAAITAAAAAAVVADPNANTTAVEDPMQKVEQEADKIAEEDTAKTEVGGTTAPPPFTDDSPAAHDRSPTPTSIPAPIPPETAQEPAPEIAAPAPEPAQDDAASSVASEFVTSTSARVHQALVLRAQMLQTEQIVADLKSEKESAGEGWTEGQEAELGRAERVLGKMERRLERRYNAACANIAPPEDVDLEGVLPREDAIAGLFEQALELHLAPGKRSFKFTVTVSKKKNVGKNQKPHVYQIIEGYQIPVMTDPNNGRMHIVEITEADYPAWLETYRIATSGEDS